MRILKCFECAYPTKDGYQVVPGGKLLPLCRICQAKIPKALNPYEQIIQSEGRRKPKSERQPGRPSKWTQSHTEQALDLLNRGLGVRGIAHLVGFSYATTWKKLRELNALK